MNVNSIWEKISTCPLRTQPVGRNLSDAKYDAETKFSSDFDPNAYSDDVGRPFRLMSAGVAGRPLDGCNLRISGCIQSSTSGTGALIAPEAAGWHDGDQFVEVEILTFILGPHRPRLLRPLPTRPARVRMA
jgi:hypothetical protein